MSRFDQPLLWSPFRLLAALLLPAAGAVAFYFALREIGAQGHVLLPPSQGAHAALTESTRWAYSIAIAVLLLLAAPWWLRFGRGVSRDGVATAWAAMAAISIWAWKGYSFNRFEAAASWRTRAELFGLSLPEALVEPSVLVRNLLTTLGALLLFLLLRVLLLRLLPERHFAGAPRPLQTLSFLVTLAAAPWLLDIGGLLRPNPRGPDIILISLDATRADRLGCYGHDGGLTPQLDSFAEGAELYRNAYAQEPWTLTSHMSMLTALYPDVHGLDFRRSLAPSVWTVGERLRDAGYRTAASVRDCYLLSPRFGYGDGFARYEEDKRPALERCRDAADWLLSSERPGFLFLHIYDPHSDSGALPYEASTEFLDAAGELPRAAFESWAGTGGASEAMHRFNLGEQPIPEQLLPWISALYDAGLRESDAALGEFFQQLRAAGRLRSALVIVVADHGEALGERDHYMHEELMQATLQIPLLIQWPNGERAGRKNDAIAETVDLAPTMLEVAGLPAEVVSQGTSLREPPARRFAFHRSGPRHAITTEDGWRLEYRRDQQGFVPLALRRLDGSGGDGPDLLADSLRVVDRWLPAIEDLHRANSALAGRWSAGDVPMSEADAELLRSLGYVE